jgi:hypothetical protein
MLFIVFLIYFLPTIVALARGHLSALAIFVLNLLLGWTLIAWLLALIWACTGHTAANAWRYPPPVAGVGMPVTPRRGRVSLWVVLLVILAGLALLDKRRDFRDLRSFDVPYWSEDDSP